MLSLSERQLARLLELLIRSSVRRLRAVITGAAARAGSLRLHQSVTSPCCQLSGRPTAYVLHCAFRHLRFYGRQARAITSASPEGGSFCRANGAAGRRPAKTRRPPVILHRDCGKVLQRRPYAGCLTPKMLSAPSRSSSMACLNGRSGLRLPKQTSNTPKKNVSLCLVQQGVKACAISSSARYKEATPSPPPCLPSLSSSSQGDFFQDSLTTFARRPFPRPPLAFLLPLPLPIRANMLLPLLFLAWLWGHVGLSVKAGPKSGHQANALVKIALVYLALVYTLAATLVVALPTVRSPRPNGFPWSS